MGRIRQRVGSWAPLALLPMFYLVWPIGAALGVKPLWLVLSTVPVVGIVLILGI